MADACIPPLVQTTVVQQPVQQIVQPQTTQQVVSQGTVQPASTSYNATQQTAVTSASSVTPPAPSVVQSVGPVGPPGPQGPSGSSSTSFTALAAQALGAGQPVYADQVTGQLKLADSGVFTRSRSVGLATAAFASGFVATVEQRLLQLADWTLATGAATLQRGANYFLGAAGTLSTSAPSATGATVVLVGTAVAADTLEIAYTPSILL